LTGWAVICHPQIMICVQFWRFLLQILAILHNVLECTTKWKTPVSYCLYSLLQFLFF